VSMDDIAVGMGSPDRDGAYLTDDARWRAVVDPDRGADGIFVYGVLTTGVYCRPGCASRLPKRGNVRFFATSSEAAAARLRPCKRCRPQIASPRSTAEQAVARACEIVASEDRAPTLTELADAVGLSPSYFHRKFKAITGVTPKQYILESRAARVREGIRQANTITDAIYDAGYASSSRFYDTASSSLGMRPGEYRRGGVGVTISYAITDSYLGWVLVATTELGICRIDIDASAEALRERLVGSFAKAQLLEGESTFQETVARVVACLEQPRLGLRLPLDVRGTAFQRRVWAALQEIPAGSTASYSEVAGWIGQPKAARAVARACAGNQIAVAVPCHRVVRSDGGLGGYRWGVARKRELLARESDGMEDAPYRRRGDDAVRHD